MATGILVFDFELFIDVHCDLVRNIGALYIRCHAVLRALGRDFLLSFDLTFDIFEREPCAFPLALCPALGFVGKMWRGGIIALTVGNERVDDGRIGEKR